MSALDRLVQRLRAEGGPVAEAVVEAPAGDTGPYPVEAIREGYLLHYGDARVVATEDPDLALLAGDRLYALGLAELAELGDLEAVRTMAEVIARSASAHGTGDGSAAAEAWAMAPSTEAPGPGDR